MSRCIVEAISDDLHDDALILGGELEARGRISIRSLIEQVQSGQVRIPAFQRGFVWDADRIAYLMDSIYKGYPFGSVILWQTKEQLAGERRLGPFALPNPIHDYPIKYVLDGQQRLTSIFGTFQTELEPEEGSGWPRIYFDLAATEDLQDSQFVALSDEEVIEGQHFPIDTFFDTTAYRRATGPLTNEQAELIDTVQASFKEAKIPTQDLVTDNRGKVAIVSNELTGWVWSSIFSNYFRRGHGARNSISKSDSQICPKI